MNTAPEIREEEVRTMPRIGDVAPSFGAMTTQGPIHFPSDFKDKWIILFSHPADFTPVCTSEFMTFGKMAGEFEELNCQLVGLSIDGLYSHIAWLRTIHDKIEYRGMKNIEVRFPLIDDVGMNVAKMYGMIQPGESKTQAVRAVFFIDPQGIIRAIVYYPLALGRNFDEIKRVLVGLQTIDSFGAALPADWRPGDDVIVPTPGSCGAAKERMEHKKDEMTCCDWFFCTRPLPKAEVEYALTKKSMKKKIVMKTTVEVENAMVCGCRNSVHRGLSALQGVFGVEVDPARGLITVEHTDEVGRRQIERAIGEMGYRVVQKKTNV